MKNTFGRKEFRKILILMMVFNFSTYFTTGFLGIFKTKDLLLSLLAVQTINMVANGFRVLVSIPFGKYSDRHSFAKGFELALLIGLVAYICLMFTTKKTWFLIVAYSILYNISVAGTNQNSFNIMYSYVDIKYMTQAMAIKNCVGGAIGFGASLVGGKLLAFVQENGNKFLGIPMYGQQLLAFVSLILTMVAILYIHFVIGKQKTKIQ